MKLRAPRFVARAARGSQRVVRNLTPKTLWWKSLAFVIAVAVVLGALTPIIVQKITGIPDGVALRVGNTDVTQDQVKHRISVVHALYGVEEPDDPAQQDQFRRDAAKSVAVGVVLENAARSRGVMISNESANETLKNMIGAQLAPTGPGSFPDLLRTYGASQGDVIDEIKRQQSTDRLYREVTADASANLDDQSVKNYYQDHQAEMVTSEKREIQNIVVTSPDQGGQVAGLAKSGKDFPGLVKKYSLDRTSNTTNGELGLVARSDLEDKYGRAAFEASVGSVFGPVQTTHGWNVGRVVRSVPSVPLPFDQVKDQLRDRLVANSVSKKWQSWLADEIRNAEVEYAEAYRPTDPDALPPAPEFPVDLERGNGNSNQAHEAAEPR